MFHDWCRARLIERFAPASSTRAPDQLRWCPATLDPGVLDVVVVPGLAFTPDGHRLGQGGGHFDRFLPRLAVRCLRVGVCFREQLVDELPMRAPRRRGHQSSPMVSRSERSSSERTIIDGRSPAVSDRRCTTCRPLHARLGAVGAAAGRDARLIGSRPWQLALLGGLPRGGGRRGRVRDRHRRRGRAAPTARAPGTSALREDDSRTLRGLIVVAAGVASLLGALFALAQGEARRARRCRHFC